ncbi:MAG: DUF1552 domain-containing protein [Candidatus Solibacter sp.]
MKRISRRTLLRGAGVAVSLPWLEIMGKAAPATTAETLSAPPLRLAYLFVPNGVRPDYWTPPGDGETYDVIPPHLKPLEPFKGDFSLLENLWNEQAQGRNGHWPKVPAWLSGGRVARTAGDDLYSGGVSVDQLLAQRIGDRTLLPSLELGIDSVRSGIDTAGGGFARMYGSLLSWRDEKTPVIKEIIPQLAFDRVFRTSKRPAISSVDPTNPSLLTALQRDDASILDLVLEDAKAVRRQGSAGDKVRLDEYFDSLRSVETRLTATLKPQKRWINKGEFPLDRPAPGTPDQHADHVRLMLDILTLAFWTDTTRVSTFMFGDAQTMQDYSFLPGVRGSFHSISHHGDEPEKREQYEKIINWHYEQVAYFLGRLKSLNEGETSLLDNSMIVMGGSLKDGNRHLEEDLPLLIAGRGKGTLNPGRRVRSAVKTPMCNLHLALMQRMGVMDKSFGDSTEPLKNL